MQETQLKDTGAERRNYARERIHIEVEIFKDFKHISGMMEYLSYGGALVSLPKPFIKDSLIQIKFDIPGELCSFQGKAKVVWVRKDRAMGIQFVDLSSNERIKLEKLLTQ